MTRAVHLNTLGLVCALGSGTREVADRLFAGDTSGIRILNDAVVSGDGLPFGAVETELPRVPERLQRYTSRNFSLALAALQQIDGEIKAAMERFGAHRVAVVMGTSTSGISEGERLLRSMRASAADTLPRAFDFRQQEIGSVAESIAACYGLTAPAITVSTACSSGAKALAAGRRLIRQDLADVVIAGGCDSRCTLTLNGFNALSALSRTGCRPFSVNRDGTVIGEGAAIFLMSRDAEGPVLAGVGESSDAHNITAPDPSGRGAIAAMRAALVDAAITPGQLSYVNLHGTATTLNDAMESRALTAVAGEVPCSSSKGQVGHTLGAAGAIEAAFCWLTLERNPERRLPPHVWDGAVDIDARLSGLVVDDQRLDQRASHWLMSNSYAFGGSNVALILGTGS